MEGEDCLVCTFDLIIKIGWLFGTSTIKGRCKHLDPNCKEPKYQSVPILFTISFSLFSSLLIYAIYSAQILQTKKTFDLEFSALLIEILISICAYTALLGAAKNYNILQIFMNGFCAILSNSSYYGIKTFLPRRARRIFRAASFSIFGMMFLVVTCIILFFGYYGRSASRAVLTLKIFAISLCWTMLATMFFQVLAVSSMAYLIFLIAFERLKAILIEKMHGEEEKRNVGMKLEIALMRMRRLYLATKKNHELVNETLNPQFTLFWLLVVLILVFNFYYVVVSIAYSFNLDYFIVVRNVGFTVGVLIFNVCVQNISAVVSIHFFIALEKIELRFGGIFNGFIVRTRFANGHF